MEISTSNAAAETVLLADALGAPVYGSYVRRPGPLPMDVMEEMTTVDIGEVSTIDRAAVAGSLDRLAEYLAAIPPGKLAIIALRPQTRLSQPCRPEPWIPF